MRFHGTVWRAHDPRWAFAPASGDGATRRGGRFNPFGVPALYTSLDLQTAWREAQQSFALKLQPMTTCAYDVDCEDVLDLTTRDGLAEAGVRGSDLAMPWEEMASDGLDPPTWQVARRLIARGVAAIIVPSFAPGATAEDRNVVFWRWSDSLPHRVVVVDDHGRLPRDGRSWG